MKSGLTSAHVLLANTYAATGDFYRASNIRMQISELGLKRRMGVSRTMVNGEITVSGREKNSKGGYEWSIFS